MRTLPGNHVSSRRGVICLVTRSKTRGDLTDAHPTWLNALQDAACVIFCNPDEPFQAGKIPVDAFCPIEAVPAFKAPDVPVVPLTPGDDDDIARLVNRHEWTAVSLASEYTCVRAEGRWIDTLRGLVVTREGLSRFQPSTLPFTVLLCVCGFEGRIGADVLARLVYGEQNYDSYDTKIQNHLGTIRRLLGRDTAAADRKVVVKEQDTIVIPGMVSLRSPRGRFGVLRIARALDAVRYLVSQGAHIQAGEELLFLSAPGVRSGHPNIRVPRSVVCASIYLPVLDLPPPTPAESRDETEVGGGIDPDVWSAHSTLPPAGDNHFRVKAGSVLAIVESVDLLPTSAVAEQPDPPRSEPQVSRPAPVLGAPPSMTVAHPTTRALVDSFANLNVAIELLTEAQATLIGEIDDAHRAGRHALVEGSAGSGKTLLAMRLALARASSGGRVLFLCHNPRLKRRVAETIASAGVGVVDVGTWVATLAGLPVPQGSSEDWSAYHEPDPHYIELATSGVRPVYDLVVIDEAQDFRDEWFALAERAIRSNGKLAAFHDPVQSLIPRREAAWARFDVMPTRLLENLRSAGQIAEAVRRANPASAPGASELRGRGVVRCTQLPGGMVGGWRDAVVGAVRAAVEDGERALISSTVVLCDDPGIAEGLHDTLVPLPEWWWREECIQLIETWSGVLATVPGTGRHQRELQHARELARAIGAGLRSKSVGTEEAAAQLEEARLAIERLHSPQSFTLIPALDRLIRTHHSAGGVRIRWCRTWIGADGRLWDLDLADADTIPVMTVPEFKGLESDFAVVVVTHDHSAEFYVAISRARRGARAGGGVGEAGYQNPHVSKWGRHLLGLCGTGANRGRTRDRPRAATHHLPYPVQAE